MPDRTAGRGTGARVIPLAHEQRRKARKVTPNEVAARARAAAASRRQARSARRRADVARLPSEGARPVYGALADPRLRKAASFARRRLEGQYVVDEYGYDEELVEDVMAPLLDFLYESYWRVEVRGAENVPKHGPALLCANHSGVLPWDGVMLTLAVRNEVPSQPVLRLLAADLLWRIPFLSHWARKAGITVACDADAERLLLEGEMVGTFPEGFKGIGKPFSERYRLQRFGRGGYVEVAIRTGAVIVPVGIVGAEETYPMLGDVKILARLLGTPYFPVTPTFPLLGPLGAIPLPSKWIIEFGPPVETEDLMPEAAQDAMTVFNINDGIRDTIQQILYRNIMQRRSWFW
ncbi:MAG: acyltransferase family protein [Actinobacteria bacterium ATB1]|nr:acyltransferase family protein [Actinobacteria bacterium ATB1]